MNRVKRLGSRTTKIGKYTLGSKIQYRGEWFQIESFPDGHSIVASNLSDTSDLPKEIRILIAEL